MNTDDLLKLSSLALEKAVDVQPIDEMTNWYVLSNQLMVLSESKLSALFYAAKLYIEESVADTEKDYNAKRGILAAMEALEKGLKSAANTVPPEIEEEEYDDEEEDDYDDEDDRYKAAWLIGLIS